MISAIIITTGNTSSDASHQRKILARQKRQLFISSWLSSSWTCRPLLLLLLLLVFQCNVSFVWGISRCNQYTLASASIMAPPSIRSYYWGSSIRCYPHSSLSCSNVRGLPPRKASFSRSKRRRGSSRKIPFADSDIHSCYDDEAHEPHDPYWEETQAVARFKRKKTKSSDEDKDSESAAHDNNNNSNHNDPFATPMSSAEIYSQLGPIGKCVAGTTEIAVSTCMEYITGFMGGYILGSITDVPRFAFKKVDPTNNPNNPFFKELAQRYGRMHAKSFRWAKSWGSISAAFGGFRVATRVIRGGKEDEWNTVFSSAAAGAFFARNGTYRVLQ